MKNYRLVDFEVLKGKTIKAIEDDVSQIDFVDDTGTKYSMYHDQDCCESVELEDICGNLEDLIDTPIVDAYKSTNDYNPKDEHSESFTWTFFTLVTIKGTVVVCWYGESDGDCSEDVDLYEVS